MAGTVENSENLENLLTIRAMGFAPEGQMTEQQWLQHCADTPGLKEAWEERSGREALADQLREHTAMRFMGDCECGNCQLVSRPLLDRAIAAAEDRDRLLATGTALVDRDCHYDGGNIVIPCGSHAEAIRLMREFRAAIAKATTSGGQS